VNRINIALVTKLMIMINPVTGKLTFIGRCICEHNTAGDNCEVCAPGFYGNALQGTESDCEPCPCPQQGACVILPDESVACLQCPEGYAGNK
jgi:coxsackievirus/adenovirus receptor